MNIIVGGLKQVRLDFIERGFTQECVGLTMGWLVLSSIVTLSTIVYYCYKLQHFNPLPVLFGII